MLPHLALYAGAGMRAGIGAGKDTIARMLCEHHGYRRGSFTDRLRDFVYAVSSEYRAALDAAGGDYEVAKRNNPIVRDELIRYGEAAKAHIHPGVWVDSVLSEMQFFAEFGTPTVVTDPRFDVELKALRGLGAKLVLVTRPGVELVHDQWTLAADYAIANNGTLNDLDLQVQLVVNALRFAGGA